VKARTVRAERINARAVLASANVAIDQDFHSLRSAQVDIVLAEATRVRYREPANANGSRARYFYALLLRRAKMGVSE